MPAKSVQMKLIEFGRCRTPSSPSCHLLIYDYAVGLLEVLDLSKELMVSFVVSFSE